MLVDTNYPSAPSYLNSRLLGYVTFEYIEPSSHDLGNWSPKVNESGFLHMRWIFSYPANPGLRRSPGL